MMAKRLTGLVYVLTMLIPAIFWKINHGALGELDRDTLILAIGRLCGLLGSVGLVWQLLLISRAKMLEARFGLDTLTRFHHLNGFMTVVFLVFHGPMVTWGHASQAMVSCSEQLTDFLKNWNDLPQASIGQIFLFIVFFLSIGFARRRLSYETWYRMHLLGYLGIILAFGHQLEQGKEFVDHPAMTNYWYAFYGIAFLLLIGRRFFMPLLFFIRHRFEVEKTVAEAGDAVSVYIRGNELAAFPARGGQFLRVRFLAPGFIGEAHPFSLSAPPNKDALRLTIKQSGDFTKKIPRLLPGTRVLIDGPHGIFTADRVRGTKVLLIAGGIGITPIHAILDDLLHAGKDLVLLFCNRNEKGITLRAELDAVLASVPGAHARIVHILSDDPTWTGEKGHLDQERLRRLVTDAAEREVFLCGPPPMMEKLRITLTSIGVPLSAIYDERFSL
ncbi:MAG: ferric reductase-like transmembrane domain-containing protein [Candidatus Ozemobacteraceae bacterium]